MNHVYLLRAHPDAMGPGAVRASAWLSPCVAGFPESPEICEAIEAGQVLWLNRIALSRGTQHGRGWGTRLLQRVCDAADEEGVTLVLGVDPDHPEHFSSLVDWYERFGFAPENPKQEVTQIYNVMVRKPIAG